MEWGGERRSLYAEGVSHASSPPNPPFGVDALSPAPHPPLLWSAQPLKATLGVGVRMLPEGRSGQAPFCGLYFGSNSMAQLCCHPLNVSETVPIFIGTSVLFQAESCMLYSLRLKMGLFKIFILAFKLLLVKGAYRQERMK